MANSLVLEARAGDVATLTFNDPERLNAMTAAMGEALADRIAVLSRDESLRAVVLTGTGRAFSAGGDLDMLRAKSAEGRAEPGIARRPIRNSMHAFYKLFLSVRDLACPTIAAINGPAIGAGLCVALACDLRIVSKSATLGLNFTKLDLHPGMGATWTLPRLVGPALAAELLYTSRMFKGEEAAAMGLANRAVEVEAVLSEARSVADAIAGCGPTSVRGTKRALARSMNATLDDQLFFEASEQAICFEGDDALEGIDAAVERREPKFQGK
jgi:enoyl-CoA hydratase